MFDLSGKIAFITGATGAIGSCIARFFHKQGATVVLSGTNGDKLEQLKREFENNVYCYSCNLEIPEDIVKTYAKVESDIGKISILTNNAGITKDGLLMRMNDESWEQVLSINLKAPFILMREAVKSMIKQNFGRIINLSSIVGITGNPGQTNYSATKAGIIGMSKSVAGEVASRGITVNCIAPGFVKSAMTDQLTELQQQKLISNIPMRAVGLPEDIAATAVFLASDEARYITGQTVHVNGGMLMV